MTRTYAEIQRDLMADPKHRAAIERESRAIRREQDRFRRNPLGRFAYRLKHSLGR